MLLCDHFVFVHFLKTGGTFVKQALIRHAPADWHCVDLDGHPSVADIPHSHRHLPRFGFVRNPWDWYVSAYHYFSCVATDPLFQEISRSRSLDFNDTIRRAFETEPFRSSDLGPMSWYFEQIFAADAGCTILRFESLRADFRGYLERLGLAIPGRLEQAIGGEPALNSSPRSDYRGYYDRALADEIGRRDAGLIERFDYRFSADPPPPC